MGTNTEELNREIATTRADMSDTLAAIGDRVSPGRMMQRRKNKVKAGVDTFRSKVMGSATDTHDTVASMAETASDAIRHTPDKIAEKTQGAPLVAGALAFGVGFLVAAVFPPTQKEKELSAKIMESAEPAKAQLIDSAHEVAEHLKEPAKDAVQAVKDAGAMSVQAISDHAKDAADTTKQQMGSTTE